MQGRGMEMLQSYLLMNTHVQPHIYKINVWNTQISRKGSILSITLVDIFVEVRRK